MDGIVKLTFDFEIESIYRVTKSGRNISSRIADIEFGITAPGEGDFIASVYLLIRAF